jgi:hypothetical protein
MSTRATVHFQSDGKTEAIVYRHFDGDSLDDDLEEFFKEVQEQTDDTRFDDPTYLAARYVVWQAQQYAKHSPGKPLAFTGVGVYQRDPSDIAYRWLVSCDGGVPRVKRQKIK